MLRFVVWSLNAFKEVAYCRGYYSYILILRVLSNCLSIILSFEKLSRVGSESSGLFGVTLSKCTVEHHNALTQSTNSPCLYYQVSDTLYLYGLSGKMTVIGYLE